MAHTSVASWWIEGERAYFDSTHDSASVNDWVPAVAFMETAMRPSAHEL